MNNVLALVCVAVIAAPGLGGGGESGRREATAASPLPQPRNGASREKGRGQVKGESRELSHRMLEMWDHVFLVASF